MDVALSASLEIGVVDEEDRPVPRARVVLGAEPGDESSFFTRLTADEAGRAEVRGLTAGRYALAATTPEGADFRRGMLSLELHGGDARRVFLRFEEGARLSGVVVDEAERPLADVEVQVSPRTPGELSFRSLLEGAPEERLSEHFILGRLEDDSRPLTRSVRTGPDGRFSIDHLLPRPYGVLCEAVGYVQATVTRVWSDWVEGGEEVEAEGGYESLGYLRVPAGERDCRVVLAYQGIVSGRVLRADGEPLSSFQVGRLQYRRCPDGTFRMTSQACLEEPYRQRLWISAPGFIGIEKEFTASVGEDVDLGDIVLEQGRPVRVSVVESGSSRPVKDARLVDIRETSRDRRLEHVELGRDSGGWTDEAGTCLLPAVPRVPLAFTVTCQGYADAHAVLGPEEREVTVALCRGTLVRGRVRVGGVPLRTGWVELRSPSRSGRDTLLDVEEGAFSGPVHPPGRYVVRVSSRDSGTPEPVFLRRQVVVPEEGTLELDFDDVPEGATLEVGYEGSESLRGLVLLEGVHPLPLSAYAFRELAELGHPEEKPGPLGATHFRKVPAGRYTLLGMYVTRDKDKLFFRRELELPAEGTVKLELREPPPLTPGRR